MFYKNNWLSYKVREHSTHNESSGKVCPSWVFIQRKDMARHTGSILLSG
jgi:hypothetical protein